MEQIKRRRLSAKERRALLARFAKCGLAVEAFCRRESLYKVDPRLCVQDEALLPELPLLLPEATQ